MLQASYDWRLLGGNFCSYSSSGAGCVGPTLLLRRGNGLSKDVVVKKKGEKAWRKSVVDSVGRSLLRLVTRAQGSICLKERLYCALVGFSIRAMRARLPIVE